MIHGRDAQPEPAFENDYQRERAEALGRANMLARLIEDELTGIDDLPVEQQIRRRAWIAEATERRKDWLKRAEDMAELDRRWQRFRQSEREARRYRARIKEAAE